MSTQIMQPKPFTSSEASQWFEEFIAQLRADQLALEMEVATDEKKALFRRLMSGNREELAVMVRRQSTEQLVKYIIVGFLNEILTRQTQLKRLAFDWSNGNVWVWAEIGDDDTESEADIVLAAARINAKFYSATGLFIQTSIVEECEQQNIPEQYQAIQNIKPN